MEIGSHCQLPLGGADGVDQGESGGGGPMGLGLSYISEVELHAGSMGRAPSVGGKKGMFALW